LKKWVHAIDVDWEKFPILRGRLLKNLTVIGQRLPETVSNP